MLCNKKTLTLALLAVLCWCGVAVAMDNRHILTMFYPQSIAEVTLGGQTATFGGQPVTW